MTTMRLAVANARAYRGGLTGTCLVLALAGVLLSLTGVLVESGLRAAGAASADGAMLATVAGSFGGTAMAVVVLVVASTVALALRQRRRELALLRAVGATRRQVRRLVGAELALATIVAAPPGAVAGLLAARRLTPLLVEGGVVSDGFHLTLSPLPVVFAVVLLLPVALVAATLATRETLRTPPTEAVRESVVEPRTVGRSRRVTAAVLAALGLMSATTPGAVSGTMGAATAATSALLLVGAAAVAGPLLVGWCLDRRGIRRLAGGASGRLAVANTRGFSRRLTAAVVPLALALAAGTVQSSTDRALADAARAQLEAGLHADAVVTQPGITAAQVRAVAATPGVVSAVPLSTIPAQVRTDEDGVPGLPALSWDPTQMRVLPTTGAGGTLDLDTVAGSLGDLRRPDTIAASTDALVGTGIGVGDRVEIRLAGTETTATLVATYRRGLGFGDYLTGAATADAHGARSPADTVVIVTRPGTRPTVLSALHRAGLAALDKEAYVAAATTPQAGAQRLSLALLLALLAFIALAAGNTLVMTTASRQAELALLQRTGATRRQLLAMATWEAAISAVTAWTIGTAAVVPSVLGVSYGLLGWTVPRVDLTTYAALSALVVVIALATTVPTVAWQLRRATRRH